MKKLIKWVFIGIGSIILIVIIAGIYKFNYLANQAGYNVDGNKMEEIHSSEVLLKWFNLNTPGHFYIQIPETNIDCEITELLESDSLHLAKGYYSVGKEKGEVLVDNREIVALNKSTDNVSYLIIPFSVSNQGSGTFKYLGIFKLDYKAKNITQTDEYFIGDRVKINSITYDDSDELKVELKVHAKNQAMSEKPSKSKELTLKIKEGKFVHN